MEARSNISRRGFVGGLGALAAGSLAGALPATALAAAGSASQASGSASQASGSKSAATTVSISYADTISWDAEYDVIVVGWGSAGSVSAITAAENGAKVLLTEKAPEGDEGGNTRYCEQLMCIPASYDDGVAFYSAMANGFDTATEDVIDFMAQGATEIGDWLLAHGAQTFSSDPLVIPDTTLDDVFATDDQKWYYEMSDGSLGFSEYPVWPDGTVNDGRVREFSQMDSPDNEEKKYWNLMQSDVLAMSDQIDVWYESPAEHLIQDPFSKTILGVQISHEGSTVNVRANNGVILTCGSYEANQEMFQNYAQYPIAYPFGSLYNTGDGIKMGIEVGADLWHMDALSGPWIVAKLHGSDRVFSTTYRHQRITNAGNCIYVAGNAKRFMNESGNCEHGHINYGGTHLSQPVADVMWAVMDATGRAADGDISLIKDEDMVVADTIEELAAGMELDAETLVATVDEWNTVTVANGTDPEFNRFDFTLAPIETAPFYAVRLYPGCVNCQGGPKRDVQCEVLDTAGNPIPNLYSAGELGSFWAGVYICGGNIAETIYTGRRAGENAAKEKDAPAAVELAVSTK